MATSKKTRKRIYLGAFGDDPLKLLRFETMFRTECALNNRDIEALKPNLKHYIENTTDPETRMAKPELAIN